MAKRPKPKKRAKAKWADDPTQDPLYPFPEQEILPPIEVTPQGPKKPSFGSVKKRYRDQAYGE